MSVSSGSFWSAATEAVFWISIVARSGTNRMSESTSTVRLTLVVSPAARSPRLQVIVEPVVSKHSGDGRSSETKLTPAGNSSVKITSVASRIPSFVTVIV